MKTKITILSLMTCFCLQTITRAQINEGFTSPFSFTTSGNGWLRVNNSSPSGTQTWMQGNGAATFNSYNGGPDDFVACNFNSQGTGPGGISNFLITPIVPIQNGGVFQFATRTTTSGTWPDRLQLRYSFGTGGTIPSGTTSVGTFTNLLLDINPNLSVANTSVVSNGTVAGYPQSWAVYTFTLSGITAPGQGRFAFRYFVDDGGPTGANSDYIGIDAVNYSAPCSVSLTNYTVCSGSSTTLNAIGGTPPLTYTWSPGGGASSSLVVTPASTSVYTLSYSETSGICPPVMSTVTVGNQLSAGISASSSTVCSGTPVTLIATAAATNYSWSTGATGPVVTVTPTSGSSTYSLGVSNGACFGGNTISIAISPNPSLSITFSPAIICCNATIDVVFTGATTYTSYLNTFAPLVGNPIFLYTDATDSNTNFTLMVQGTGTNGCVGTASVIQYIQPLPTITVVSNTVACTSSAITLTASGASTYTWSGPGSVSGSANPATFITPIAPGAMNITAQGTTSLGCLGSTTRLVTVSDCVGLNGESPGSVEVSIFPNPFSNEIQITGYIGKAEVYNVVGQLLITQTIHTDERIVTTELAKGVYFVKLLNDEGVVQASVKLIKN